MDQVPLGKQISAARKQQGLTQAALADKCNLDIRTIQRIESGSVTPRFYTIRLIKEVLGVKITMNIDDSLEAEKILEYRRLFKKRKKIRIAAAFTAIFLMVAVVLLAFPSWVLFGMPKLVWGPFFYLLMFGHIIGIAITWRCPGCNGLLGDAFNTNYCSKCGLKFIE
jgi:transcriptional regulator with XRE-family HTH domain